MLKILNSMTVVLRAANHKTIARNLGLAAATALAIGCHSVRRGEPITDLLANNDPAVERGKMVFMRNCHECHLNGEGGLGPALNDKPAPRFLMKTQVRMGLGTMPAFDKDKISPDELNDLTEYILALRRSDKGR
jgi:mono/diheme cytochrome c family protein